MNAVKKSLTWLGHNCFQFQYGNVRFVVDPFKAQGVAPSWFDEIEADYALVSHGHSDHCQNALELAKRTGATIVSIAEVASFFDRQGAKTEAMNIGGAIYVPTSEDPNVPMAQILAVQAPHSSSLPNGAPGGNSVGFVLSFSRNGSPLCPDVAPIKPMKTLLRDASAFSIYFACDAGYFSEMNWLGEFGLDVVVLPIGDRYTMGPSVSLDAINALNPQYVVPSHYNTWTPLKQDVDKWSDAVRQYTKATPLPLAPGQTIHEKDDMQWN